MHDLPIAECRLDLGGLRKQRDRYRRLGRSARRVTRAPRTLTATFTDDVDNALVIETIAIERTCCPFFELRYDPDVRQLMVGVGAPDQDPALDALLAALGVDASAMAGDT